MEEKKLLQIPVSLVRHKANVDLRWAYRYDQRAQGFTLTSSQPQNATGCKMPGITIVGCTQDQGDDLDDTGDEENWATANSKRNGHRNKVS
jgi:hypothetical protein